MPDIGVHDKTKAQQFIVYFENTWIKENCHFDRSQWNLFDTYSSRTNNISETYNHKINGKIQSSDSNVFKVLDMVQDQESLIATKYQRVLLGQENKRKTSQQLKDAKIAMLKNQYKHGELDVFPPLC